MPELVVGFDALEPQSKRVEQVRERRTAGELVEDIAREFDIDISTVSRWCMGIEVLSPTETEVLGFLQDGHLWRTSDIEKYSKFTRQAVTIAIKKLLDKKLITKTKRGHYRKSGV